VPKIHVQKYPRKPEKDYSKQTKSNSFLSIKLSMMAVDPIQDQKK